MFYAHTRDDGSRQTVEEHLRGTMKEGKYGKLSSLLDR